MARATQIQGPTPTVSVGMQIASHALERQALIHELERILQLLHGEADPYGDLDYGRPLPEEFLPIPEWWRHDA